VGTVTVATVYGNTGFTNFAILGNCVISNGVWTHVGPQNTETNRLRVTIGGNLIVGSNASINATGVGFSTQRGPGYLVTGGAAHGGHGDPAYGQCSCYGSVVAPTNWVAAVILAWEAGPSG